MRSESFDVTLELFEAIRAYDAQRPGRGARFVAQVEATFRRIQQHPLAAERVHVIRRPALRRAKVERFPYFVVYYLEQGEPVVIAIAHARKKALYWRDRVRGLVKAKKRSSR